MSTLKTWALRSMVVFWACVAAGIVLWGAVVFLQSSMQELHRKNEQLAECIMACDPHAQVLVKEGLCYCSINPVTELDNDSE